MAGVVEDLVSGLIEKGVERIASRKNLTSQDLTVLLLHQQSRSISKMEKGMERLESGMEGLQQGMIGLQQGMARLENGMDGIVGELKGFRQEFVPLLDQARAIAEIRARMERIEAKLS